MIITFSSIQTNCKLDKYEENFKNATDLLKNLPETDRHIVLLPELWTSGFTENLSAADIANKEILNSLVDLAVSKNLVIAGSYVVQENKNFYNQLIVIHSNGRDIAKYNKIHLFPQMREKTLFIKGSNLALAQIWGVKIGLAVCYDLRFPELFRDYAAMKAEVCILPAQWPLKRIPHFKTLLSARAIENQMIFLATNTCGKTENTVFGGSSSLIDASGKIIFELDNHPQGITEKVNIDDLEKLRSDFPVLEDANLRIPNEIDTFVFS
jgi:predicted amidohydrolase